jgi:hypothetical protein
MRLWKLLSVFFTLTFLTLCSDGKIDNGSSQIDNGGSQQKIKPPELPEDIKNFLQGPPALAKAKNCENVVAYLSTLIGAQIERMKNVDANKIKRGGGAETTTLPAQAEVSTDFSQNFVGEPQPEFSQTNVLERGIDEADIVKTDGKFIYLVDQGLIRVVSAYPPDQITTVAQISTQGAEILTLERKIYSFSGRADWYWWWWDPWFIWYGDGGYNLTSKIEQINLDGNKLSPELVLDIEGIYDSARLYKGDIFVVGTSYLKVSNYANYANSYGIKKFVLGEGTDISVFLPKVRFIKFIDDGTAVLEEKPIADCENIYISSVTRGIGVIWVFVKSGDEIKRYAVLGVSGLITKPYVYMSQEALYILFSDAEWKTTEEGIWIQEPRTVIYKLKIENGELVFQAGTEVEGMIPDRWWSGQNALFSINEYNGFLRVALTTRVWGAENPDNMIFIFDQNLKKVGELRGLKPEEDIYAVRFVGERGYVVTFRMIDPLFVLDLSDPQNPKIAGKLEIPGFSTYIHPIGNNKLFAVGRENGKLQVSLFDVSDPQSPKPITRIYLSENWSSRSEGEWNYKAITFFKDFVALPFTGYKYYYSSCYYSDQEAGFIIFGISDNSINLKGKAIPEELCKEETRNPYRGCEYTSKYCSNPLRAVFIDRFIYGVMSGGIKVWDYDLGGISFTRF